jgi:hypothetical protein
VAESFGAYRDDTCAELRSDTGKSDLENDDKVPRWGGNQKGHLLRQVFYKPADYVEYLY